MKYRGAIFAPRCRLLGLEGEGCCKFYNRFFDTNWNKHDIIKLRYFN